MTIVSRNVVEIRLSSRRLSLPGAEERAGEPSARPSGFGIRPETSVCDGVEPLLLCFFLLRRNGALNETRLSLNENLAISGC